MSDTIEITASRHGAAYVIIRAVDTFALEAAPAFGLREYSRSDSCPVRGAIVRFSGTPREARAFAEYCA